MDRNQQPGAGVIHNRWRLGPRELHLTKAPEHLRGATGCILNYGTFDATTGPEVYLVILESGKHASEIAATRPFSLFCKTGAAQTDHGLVAFLLWTVFDSSQRVAWYEQFMNPYNAEALRLLEVAGRQTHFKALVFDSLRHRVVDWFEFANGFRLGEFADRLRQWRADQTQGDFEAAQADFARDYNVEVLFELEPER